MDLFKHFGLATDCLFCGALVETSAQPSQPIVANLYDVDPSALPIICRACHQYLPFCINNCLVCGLPLSPVELERDRGSLTMPCGACLKTSPPYDFTLSAFHYGAPINRLITRLKYGFQFQYLPLLTAYLRVKISDFYSSRSLPDAMIPVPLHPSKLRARGFNQANLIAFELSQSLDIPYLCKGIVRQKRTIAQSSLNAKQRQSNLKKAFRIDVKLPPRVAIIDDVVTTGTTVSELAKRLRKAGARKIDVWSIARAYDI